MRLIWSSYSVLSRRLVADVLSDAVTASASPPQFWLCWCTLSSRGRADLPARDVGTKRGALQVLGAAAYLAPPISALLLMAMGRSEPSWRLAAAAALIIGGAVIAGRAQSGRDPASATA